MLKNQDIYNQVFQEYKIKPLADFFDSYLPTKEFLYSDQQILSEPLNSNKQRVIAMDCLRTRGTILSSKIKWEMQCILTHYCRIMKLGYKQGLNEILGVFIIFRNFGFSVGKCQALFHSFFSKYFLNFYLDDDFSSLQIFFKMVSILLKYHNPGVSRFLQTYDIQPQVFCISWLMTLFANKLSLKLTLKFWQYYLIEDDKFFLLFIVVAIVIFNKDSIIQTKNHSVLQRITDMMFKDQKELQQIIKIALIIRKNTPSSLIMFFKERKIFQRRDNYQDVKELLLHIQKFNLFLVLGGQITLQKHFNCGLCLQGCYFCALKKPLSIHPSFSPLVKQLVTVSSDIRTCDYIIDFVVIDLRRNKSQPVAPEVRLFSVSLETPISKIEQQFIGEFIQDKGKKHFIFLLSEFTFQKLSLSDEREFKLCEEFNKLLCSFGFPFVSILEGGVAAYQNIQVQLRSKIRNSKIIGELKCKKSQNNKQQIRNPEELTKDNLFKLSELLMMFDYYYKRLISVFTTDSQVLIVTQGIFMCLQNNPSLEKLINHLIHEGSIIDYIFNNRNLNIAKSIKFYYPLLSIEKTKTKIHNQNILVIVRQHCPQHQNKQEFIQILTMKSQQIFKMYQKCQTCPRIQIKDYLELPSIQFVKNVSNALSKTNQDFKKHIKTQFLNKVF